eukprot:9500661-Pyramimonas_sp.AAC.1
MLISTSVSFYGTSAAGLFRVLRGKLALWTSGAPSESTMVAPELSWSSLASESSFCASSGCLSAVWS